MHRGFMASEAGKNSFNTGYTPTGMDSIPPVLIASLNTLGLTNDEARVYATLVLFDYAEAKEIALLTQLLEIKRDI